MSRTIIYECDKCGTEIASDREKVGGRKIQFYRFQEMNEGPTNFDAFFPDVKYDLCEPCTENLRGWLNNQTASYHAWACRAWVQAGYPVVKSKRHQDGEKCFGGGWFVVSAQLPTGQVTSHCEMDFWDLFDVPEVDRAPEWDGHSPYIAAERIRDALTTREKSND